MDANEDRTVQAGRPADEAAGTKPRSRRARDLLRGRRRPFPPLSQRGRRMLVRTVARMLLSLAAIGVVCAGVLYVVTYTSMGTWFMRGVSNRLSPWVDTDPPAWVKDMVEGDVDISSLDVYEQGIVTDYRISVSAVRADGVRSYLTRCLEGTSTPASDEAERLVEQARQVMYGMDEGASAGADAAGDGMAAGADAADTPVAAEGVMTASEAVYTVTQDLAHDPEAVERLYPEAQRATGFDYSEMDLVYWDDPDGTGNVSYRLFGDGHVERRDALPMMIASWALVVLFWTFALGGSLAVVVRGAWRPLARYDALFQAVVQLADDPSAGFDLPSEMDEEQLLLSDIWERGKADELAARAAERRKNELVAYLAHDIKTPLTSVTGYLTLLEEAPDMPEERRVRYARMALDKAYRLDGMLNEFFDISRYNLGQLVVEREHFDLALFCHQVADEFFPQAEARDIAIEVRAPEGEAVFADASKLFRAVSNVLKNAVTFADKGSTVEFVATVVPAARSGGLSDEAGSFELAPGAWPERRAERLPATEDQAPDDARVRHEGALEGVPEDPGFVITIRDRGREIAPQHLERIFEQFFREDSARTTAGGGAGLGLAIAREIMRAHGGDITAHSEAGLTTFVLTVPAPSAFQTASFADER